MLPPNLHYENGPLGNLLVWILGEQDRLVQYQLQLLARHKPDYLLPCIVRSRAGFHQLCQDASGLSPLDHACPGSHGAEWTASSGLAILQSIIGSLVDATDRLFPLQQFSLHPSLVFLDKDQKARLAFWPVMPDAGPSGDTDELDQLIVHLCHACHIPPADMGMLRQHLAESGIDGLQEALSLKSGRSGRTPSRPENAEAGSGETGPCHRMEAVRSVWRRRKTAWSQVISCFLGWCKGLPRQLNLSGGADSGPVHDQDGQTILLPPNPADFRMAMLAEGKPGTPEENEGLRAFILVDEFMIGRDQHNADLYLGDPGVGRLHARIIRRAGSFFICDLGSRNGTSLDGRRLLKNCEQLLPDQCIVQFAGRPFFFQVEGCL